MKNQIFIAIKYLNSWTDNKLYFHDFGKLLINLFYFTERQYFGRQMAPNRGN